MRVARFALCPSSRSQRCLPIIVINRSVNVPIPLFDPAKNRDGDLTPDAAAGGVLGEDNYRIAPEAPLRRGFSCDGDKACP